MKIFPKKKFFQATEEQAIIQAIRDAEKRTSGEIRVHVESGEENAATFDRALNVFQALGMQNTEQKNAVLFYIAHQTHQFAIIADEGINAAVPQDFWENIKISLQDKFAQKKFSQGIIEGIQSTGSQLKAYFPADENDQNELPDDISS